MTGGGEQRPREALVRIARQYDEMADRLRAEEAKR